MGLNAMILFFWMLSFKPAFSFSSFTSSRGCLISLHFQPLCWCQVHIWGYWYFSQQSWFQLELHPAWNFTWCTLHRSYINRVTIYSLDVLLSQSNYCFLAYKQISQETGILIFLRIFHSLLWPTQRLYHSQWTRCFFSGILLLFLWSSGCWQFDLWFLSLF